MKVWIAGVATAAAVFAMANVDSKPKRPSWVTAAGWIQISDNAGIAIIKQLPDARIEIPDMSAAPDTVRKRADALRLEMPRRVQGDLMVFDRGRWVIVHPVETESFSYRQLGS